MNTAEKLDVAKPKGLKSLLRATPQKEPVAKSKTPILEVDEPTRDLAEEVVQLKQDVDEATAQLERKAKELINKVTPQRVELCQREYISSVKVPAHTLNVGITWSSSYKKIAPSMESGLIKILGEQAYQVYFKSKFIISAVDKTDDELMQFFTWLSPNDGQTEEDLAIGQSRFTQFFAGGIEEQIKPTERFVREHPLMPESKKQELELEGVCQYKPSIRTR